MPQPTAFRWTAPTENEDGTPIVVPVDYELGEHDGTDYQPLATIVGALQPDDTYEAPVGSMVFVSGVHTLALRALAHDGPDRVASDWSNPATFTIVAKPNPPLMFSIV